MSDRLEKYLSNLITYLLAIATLLVFLVLPSVFIYIIFTKIMEREKELVIAGAILFVLTVIYNIMIFLSTGKTITAEESKLERVMGVCLRVGGSLFFLGVILTMFLLLTGLLESASGL